MRHATEEDLLQVEGLLAELRRHPHLRERSPGIFWRGSRAFLHFHADGDDTFVDVKLTGTFERVRVTTRAEQAELLAGIERALGPPA